MDSTTASIGRDPRPEPSSTAESQANQPLETAADSASASSAQSRRRTPGRIAFAIAGLALLVAALIVGAFAWWYESHFVSTDDAFIDATVVEVSPRVAGQVVAVPVKDNQKVAPGEALVRIDPTPYRLALRQALATEQQARTELGQSRANVAVARAALQQAIAGLASAHARALDATRDLQRYLHLRAHNPRAVSHSQIDQVMTAARSATAEQRAARQRIVGARAQIAAARAALAGAAARVESDKARVSVARLDLGYTTVTATVAGHVAQKSVAVGSYVTPGQSTMAVVPLHLWVTANFKETDLSDIRPGERVSIHIDACPAANAHGHVESLQRGSGEAFELLPPQNATGNYIKIVQRVPVRIAFDSLPKGCVLGPGMSVEPKVRVR